MPREYDYAPTKKAAPVYKAPAYKAPAYSPAFKRKRDEEEFYVPPSPVVPAWLSGGGAGGGVTPRSPFDKLNELGTPSGLGGGNAIVPNFNTPASIAQGQAQYQAAPATPAWMQSYMNLFSGVGGIGSPTGLGGGVTSVPNFNTPASISQGQAFHRANVMERTANRDDVIPRTRVFNPRTGQEGLSYQAPAWAKDPLQSYIDLFAGVGGIGMPTGLGGGNAIVPNFTQAPILSEDVRQYAPRENVGSLPRPFVREHVTPQMARGPQRYVSPLPETDYVDPFGTRYGGNWTRYRQDGGGGGYGGGDYPQWLKDMYDNLYSLNWRD